MTDRRFEGRIERLRSPERVERLEVSRVVDTLTRDLKSPQVLDVGTGTGLFAEAFRVKGSVVGVDVNADMVRAARELVPHVEFEVAEAEDLPYPDASFDLVFLGHVLHEATDPVWALREARRVTRRRVGVLEWPYLEESMGPPLAHRLAAEEVEVMAAKAGFANVRAEALKSMVLYVLDG